MGKGGGKAPTAKLLPPVPPVPKPSPKRMEVPKTRPFAPSHTLIKSDPPKPLPLRSEPVVGSRNTFPVIEPDFKKGQSVRLPEVDHHFPRPSSPPAPRTRLIPTPALYPVPISTSSPSVLDSKPLPSAAHTFHQPITGKAPDTRPLTPPTSNTPPWANTFPEPERQDWLERLPEPRHFKRFSDL